MARIEKLCFASESTQVADSFMEQAGLGIYLEAQNYRLAREPVFLLCAKGNNSGDAYVVGRLLCACGTKVTALQVEPLGSATSLCQAKAKRFKERGGVIIEGAKALAFKFPSCGLIIDGLVGTGFKGKLREPLLTIVKAANASKLPIIAIDIPSGVDGDLGLDASLSEVINARATLSLGMPKSGLFLRRSCCVVGQISIVDFGLEDKYSEQAEPSLCWLTSDAEIKKLLPQQARDRHKYDAGLVTILAGSPGLAGAAILASLGAYRSGAGLVRLISPKQIRKDLGQAPVELLRSHYCWKDPLRSAPEILAATAKAKAALIGPGLGQSEAIGELLSTLLPQIKVPLVLDADALNAIATYALAIPPKAILSPHAGELRRLLGLKITPKLTQSLLEELQAYCEAKDITLVVKGPFSFVIHPQSVPTVISCSDPGMATGGTGDVLAGIIAALLAAGASAHNAALAATYLHARAGERAAKRLGSHSLMASDIVGMLKF